MTDTYRPPPRDVRTLLVPREEHPQRELIDLEMSFRQLGEGTPPLPWGMVWEPASCENYMEHAFPDWFTYNGWMRTTDRRSRSFRHDNFYVDGVVEVPGGADLDRVREAAGTCRSGTLTLDGMVTGTVAYTEYEAPKLRRGSSLALHIEVRFAAAEDERTANTLARYGYGDGRTELLNRKVVNFAVTGDTLFFVLSPDRGLAARMAESVHRRTLDAGSG